ncbi:DNA/RNA non-specific endonuclease [Paraflavisolibacter sp. H34]|uniref:DNA/RNA non-specific endonuclease n=1 Tax=Huijunlia imazamoxiresistens TaxID=3127457 RepID=UPI003016C1BC
MKGYLFALFLIPCAVGCNDAPAPPPPAKGGDESTVSTPVPAGKDIGLPAPLKGEELIRHAGYTLSYNEKHEQANWVAYKLTRKGELRSANHARTDRFLADPEVAKGSAGNADYEGSGFDRGHLAPAEDMDGSKVTMAESFYYSNISPQKPAFNRGVWRRLEELVRFWGVTYDSIFIVTGPVLTGKLATIGPNKVSVPDYYFKAVLQLKKGKARAIGFLLPNEASAATLKSFAVPVDDLEKRTGLDFFAQLPDDVEKAVEKDPEIDSWKWTRSKK